MWGSAHTDTFSQLVSFQFENSGFEFQSEQKLRL